MKKWANLGICMILALAVTGCGASQKSGDNTAGATSTTSAKSAKVIQFGTGYPEEHFVFKGLQKFKQNVEQKTNQAIKVEVYPSNQLGADRKVLDSIKAGTVQMNVPSPALLGNIVKDFNIISLPFIFPSQEVADKVMEGPVGKEMLDKLTPAGFVGLGFGDFGFRHVTNSKHPIKTMDDFKGLKIRTLENPSQVEVFKALGANPTPMPFSEVFAALESKTIDGQENPLMQIYTNKFQEAQKYLTLDGHVYDWAIFVIGKKFFDDLTPEQQTIVKESARIAIDDIRAASKQKNDEALEKLKAEGMQVNELSPEARQQMIDKVKPIVDKYAQEANKGLYEKLQTEVQKYSK